MAAERSGDYLADAQVVIQSAGKERLLETTMDGPILLVKLLPGAHAISATSGRGAGAGARPPAGGSCAGMPP